MRRTVSKAPGCVPPDDDFDPLIDDFTVKERKYIHFDRPISKSDRENFSFSADNLLKHSFWPLLGFTAKERRVKKVGGQLEISQKEREIKFGSHKDAAVYEWYAKNLSVRYERLLKRYDLSEAVLAYRSGVGDNISQAGSIFSEIRNKGDCRAIALDITGFFDHIDHLCLRRNLVDVLAVGTIPDPDFRIFKRMTQFEWVDSDALRIRLGNLYG